MSFLKALKNKFKIFNSKVEDYQEAITFSEAGIHNCVSQKEPLTCSESEGKNLVVVCTENRFPGDLVKYAIEMAERMSYGIIAVNAANITHDVAEFFSTTHDKLYADFKESSTKNIETFRAMAIEHGLRFAHSVQFSNIDNAIDNISKECGHVEFVISENREQVAARGIAANEQRIAQRLCVYSVN